MQSRSLSSEFKLLSPNNTVNKTVQYTDAKGRLKFERAMSEMGKGIQWRIHNSQKISNFLHANEYLFLLNVVIVYINYINENPNLLF